MLGLLEGFGVVGLVIALGYLLARWKVLDLSAQHALARLVFFVATPALLYELLSDAAISSTMLRALAVGAISATTVALLAVLISRLVWHDGVGETTVLALASGYVNAGNLGLPIAVFVLGNGAAVAPIMLLQLLAIAPTAFWFLDRVTGRTARSPLGAFAQPLRNPVTVASFAGLVVALSSVTIPTVLSHAIEMVAAMAVPGALLAFGLSLRLGPRAFADGSGSRVAVATLLKLVVQPIVAAVVGRYAFAMEGPELLAVTLVAGLPSAQNVFIYASRYDAAVPVARDAVFATTLLCLPSLAVVAVLLG